MSELEQLQADNERLHRFYERLIELRGSIRELINDPVYAQMSVGETPTTRKTTVTDPTPLVLVSDLRRVLDGDA